MRTHPLITEWELWHVAARKSNRTTSERVRVLNQFANEIESSPVTPQPVAIMRWLQSHEDDWSDSTAATYHSYLRAWFKWLNLEGHRIDNPMIKLGTPKYPDRVPRPVEDDSLLRLLKTRMHHRTRVMILLAALGGMRVSEIARVRGEDLDLDKGVVYMIGKGQEARCAPVASTAYRRRPHHAPDRMVVPRSTDPRRQACRWEVRFGHHRQGYAPRSDCRHAA